jgi:hypothetical protein
MQAVVFGPPVPGIGTFSYYTVKEGDRLDNIANTAYSLPDYWWKLAYANPEVWYPANLVAGSIIRVAG